MKRTIFFSLLVCSLLFACKSENGKPAITDTITNTNPTDTTTTTTTWDETQVQELNPAAKAINTMDWMGNYSYDRGDAGNGTLLILVAMESGTHESLDHWSFELKMNGPKPAQNQGAMSGKLMVEGNIADYIHTSEGGGKCHVRFFLTGDQVSCKMMSGNAADCGTFGGSLIPEATFMRDKK